MGDQERGESDGASEAGVASLVCAMCGTALRDHSNNSIIRMRGHTMTQRTVSDRQTGRAKKNGQKGGND